MDSQIENTSTVMKPDITKGHLPDGTQRELTEHIEQQSPGLLRFIRRQVATVEDAEDLLQDVLAQFTIAFEGVEAIEQTASWLFRVARNRVTDWYRSRKGKNQVSIQTENDDNEPVSDFLVDEQADPDTAYWQEVLAEELEDAIAALPARQRQVFIWHEFDGLSFTDMASITEETENSLRMQKHYAMQRLRTSLNDYFDQEN